MRWAGNVAGVGVAKNAYKFWLGNLKERDQVQT